MRALRFALIACVACVGACGNPAKGHPSDGSTTYDSIDVEPAQASLTIMLGSTAQQSYQVFGVMGGVKTDITSACGLSIDPLFGEFLGAIATVNPHGGKALISAHCGTQDGTAELAVDIRGTIIVGSLPGAPGVFAGATLGSDPARAPSIQYPIDQAVSPRNIPPIEIQWAAAGNDLFHVALTSSYAAIDVYTTDVQATLADADWDAVAGTAAGGQLSIVVEGLAQAAPSTKYASGKVAITMSHDTIDKSAIYYWASSQGSIMSQTFGAVTAPTAVRNDCTACHSLSRAGSRLGYSRCVGGACGGSLMAGFMRYDPVAKQWNDTVNANDRAIHGSFSTFSPVGYPFADDSHALAIVSMATGTLSLYDPDTGAAIPSNLEAFALHGAGSALMADWAPDGKSIVLTQTPNAGQWIDLDGGSIMTMSYTYSAGTHTFGEPTPLVKGPLTVNGGSYENLFFPSFSPDGQLIVFNAARSAWRDLSNERGPGERLMLASATGAWTVDLTQMNGGTGDLDITWPHWAPGGTNDYYWIVFSSEHDYGHEVTAASSAGGPCVQNGVQQCKQIWIGAIAKNKLSGTVDPSAPPMWLPGQDTKTDNISPYWTVPTTEVQ
jgi:hypothetical protein